MSMMNDKLYVFLKKLPAISSREIKEDLKLNVSEKTIRSRLNENNITAHASRTKLSISNSKSKKLKCGKKM